MYFNFELIFVIIKYIFIYVFDYVFYKIFNEWYFLLLYIFKYIRILFYFKMLSCKEKVIENMMIYGVNF